MATINYLITVVNEIPCVTMYGIPEQQLLFSNKAIAEKVYNTLLKRIQANCRAEDHELVKEFITLTPLEVRTKFEYYWPEKEPELKE